VSFPDGVRVLAGERAIEGVKVLPLRRIPDERGTIFHMMKATDPWFERFGEIYFSTVYEGVIKGWHLHRDMTLNYACMHGRVKCAIYDDRDGSPSRGSLMEVHLGPDSYSLLVVPPGVWNGFKGISAPLAIVANCCTHAHDPARSSRMDPFDNPIPYDWALKHH
jgi:dTDP-4-dehydrorhamnose 3,5-epimerase